MIARVRLLGVALQNWSRPPSCQILSSLAQQTAANTSVAGQQKVEEEKSPAAIFSEVLRNDEFQRLADAKTNSLESRKASVQQKNHHYNRGLKGLDGPNIHGVHLPYEARVKYLRGSRGKWGSSRRGAGRLKYGLSKLADA
eukprot:CAMPEP_0197630604 /NCGR_PEP_ID=MMETSP1338-20131121/8031_1 /TAXON_ID=43686 ORGANISM="Pelagodinium beii, Strain RCC1491" /NCGR_SAMPLE_ID=MMETSP1338 /ASSEMBLY_ACC=CAM_ASM_000754 /LENGTH=140 /DNA_ID=CAMNT_0043201859 /DNA_START=20 /DNA_END=442 /DNA_ORIENTATION=-